MPYEAEFTEFWTAFPRKIGKIAAKKAYDKARRSGATQRELLDGVALYVQHKPAYADYCHPATWLNSGRWQDEWGAPEQQPNTEHWWDECQRVHGGACGLSQYRHALAMQRGSVA